MQIRGVRAKKILNSRKEEAIEVKVFSDRGKGVASAPSGASKGKYILKEALKHMGFAFIEVIQPCLIFHPGFYKEKFYSLDKIGHDRSSFE